MAHCRLAAFIVLAMVGGVSVGSASGATVRATVDRERIQVGEQVVLSIEVQGASVAEPPELRAVDGFTARYIGPATQFSLVQGRVSQSVTHRYALVGARAGRFTLGPFVVSVDGESYRTEPLGVEVVAQAQASRRQGRDRGARGPDLWLVLEPGLREVFLHERVPLTLTLYIGSARVDDVQYPRLEGDGFAVEPLGKPVQGRVTRGGTVYRTLRFETAIVPIRSGSVTLGPAVETVNLFRPRHGGDPFFDRFFGADLFAERQPHELRSNVETLTVRPLPQEGRPSGFSGAVGQFDLEISAEPRQLRASDPITMTMRITGDGDLSGISPPVVGGPGFKTYPPRDLKAEEGPNTRVVEQVLIPISEEVTEIPAVRFSYFDPRAGEYRTVSRGPIPLDVQPAQRVEVAVAPTPGAGQHAAALEELGRDIVYVKDTPGRLRHGLPFYRAPLFLGSQVILLVGYLLAWTVARRRERLRGDPRYARFKRAGREARKALAAARSRAAAGQSPAADDGLARAVREYLSAKLDLPPGAVDAERVAERLGKPGAPVLRRIDEFFALVEQARYAPAGDGAGDRRALELAEEIVRELERQRGLAQRFDGGRRLGGLVVVAILAGAAVGTAAVARDPATRFFEANALYKAGQYREAATAYEELLASGFWSGALHYNLGNALFKAGDLGRAVLNYERARRLLPRDPDVRANLRFARQQIGADATTASVAPPLWLRLLVPLAFHATTAELAIATSIAYVLTLMLLTAKLFMSEWRQALGRAAVATGVVMLVAGVSCGLRIGEEDGRSVAVIVRRGDVPVRFEPSESGTVHFSLPEGVLVRRLADREGWYLIARADGRRGWVEAEAAEPL